MGARKYALLSIKQNYLNFDFVYEGILHILLLLLLSQQYGSIA